MVEKSAVSYLALQEKIQITLNIDSKFDDDKELI